ncbi:zinc ribbon domain-containing protein [Streptomyces benahoarensis]|uniref:zinc ribbon domain-containing protein n=1 Tax=Streptomyces benahoarensis TaxID=2595054 RepID=UPI0032DE87DF
MDRAFPSSQICSVCAFRDGPKPLHVREWTCRGCGTVHGRDDNAAHNVLFEGRRIVAAGRAETLNALWSAGRTRTKFPAQRGEAGSPRKGRQAQTGIPGIQAREHVKYGTRELASPPVRPLTSPVTAASPPGAGPRPRRCRGSGRRSGSLARRGCRSC